VSGLLTPRCQDLDAAVAPAERRSRLEFGRVDATNGLLATREHAPPPGPGAALGERPRVVLVDDEADVLETVKAVLEDPFEVLAFTEPKRALAAIASMPVDVLCTDYQMPEMDGLALLTAVRKIQPNLGLILMTGRERSYYRTVARLDSSDSRDLPLHVLIKPTPPEDLIQAISRAASFSRVRRALDAIGNKGDR